MKISKLAPLTLISLALSAPALAAGKIDGSVKFYLAGTGPQGQVLSRGIVSNKKTNAFAKSDEDACQRAAQSSIIAFHNTAKKAGANAVTNITSYYRKVEYKSKTDYECHAGGVIAGVTLRGIWLRLSK